MESSPDVIREALAGNRAAVDAICAAYRVRLRGFFIARGVDPDETDDPVQETLKRLLEGLREGRVPLALEAWLMAVAKNVHTDGLRKKYRERREAGTEGLEREATAPDPSHDEEERRILLEAVDRLPEKYRVPMRLRLLKQLSYRAIAERLGAKPGTVGVWLHRGKKMLAAMCGIRRG